MPRLPRRVAESGFYHVVLYANGRQNLFEEDADRLAFLDMFVEAARKHGVSILAWCLMANHIHLLLEDPDDCLSELMRSLATRYAQRFNRRGGHAGHVFRGRFYSSPVEGEAYLLEAMRYIHNNPAKAGICAAEDYPWSSYHEYAGTPDRADTGRTGTGRTGAPDRTDTGLLLEMLGGREAFVRFSSSSERVRYRPPARPRLADAAAEEVAREVLGPLTASELKGQEQARRNALLCELREAGLSVRQVERLTGIGRGTITRATT